MADNLLPQFEEMRSTALRDAALQGFEQNGGEDYRSGRKALPEDLDASQVEENYPFNLALAIRPSQSEAFGCHRLDRS
jgi:hypothetical protein